MNFFLIIKNQEKEKEKTNFKFDKKKNLINLFLLQNEI